MTRTLLAHPKISAVLASLKPISAIGLSALRSIVSPGMASVKAFSTIIVAMLKLVIWQPPANPCLRFMRRVACG